MNTIDDLLRQGAEDLHAAVEAMPERQAPKEGRRLSPLSAALLGAVATGVLISLPVLLLGGVSDPADRLSPVDQSVASRTPTETTLATPDEGPVPDELAAYWALESTLESVGGEPGWLCPVPPPMMGYGSQVSDAEVPDALKLELPEAPITIRGSDLGPACHQPSALVLLTFSEGSRLKAEAGLAVRPQVARFEDECPAPSCEFSGDIELLEINGQPARLHHYPPTDQLSLWWVDPTGVPLYADGSGLTAERFLELASSIEVDPRTHQARIDPELLDEFEVVVSQASKGVWESAVGRSVQYQIDGASVQVATRFDASANPYARYAGNVEALELVEVADTVGVWIGEHGGFLEYTTAQGVYVVLEGAATSDQAVAIAEDLTP